MGNSTTQDQYKNQENDGIHCTEGRITSKQAWDREGRRRRLREARVQTGLKRRTWMRWVDIHIY